MSERDMLGVVVDRDVHPETVARWEQARDLAARELGRHPEELSRWEVLRELSESYVGLDGAGDWRET